MSFIKKGPRLSGPFGVTRISDLKRGAEILPIHMRVEATIGLPSTFHRREAWQVPPPSLAGSHRRSPLW